MDISRTGELVVLPAPSPLKTATLLFLSLLVASLHSREPSESELARLEWTKLTTLEPKESHVTWGRLVSGKLLWDGKPMKIRRSAVRDGFFAHAGSRLVFDIKGKGYTALRGSAGLEDGFDGSVQFKILGDGKELWQSEPIVMVRGRAEIARYALNIDGISELVLVVDDLGSATNDHSIWIEPELGKK